MGPRGRLVVPAALRSELGITEGSALIARIDGDRLILEPRSAAVRRLRERVSEVPAAVSLVDELIAERRAAARAEERS